jgi:bifunctional DNA-binding transcriptional regulator/antitoxin component of YhaV-PrlF toxin-antitoxin module
VIIPQVFRQALRWQAGQELQVIDTGDGLLLKPKAPFASTELAQAFGILRGKAPAKTDEEITAGLLADVRRRWRGRD